MSFCWCVHRFAIEQYKIRCSRLLIVNAVAGISRDNFINEVTFHISLYTVNKTWDSVKCEEYVAEQTHDFVWARDGTIISYSLFREWFWLIYKPKANVMDLIGSCETMLMQKCYFSYQMFPLCQNFGIFSSCHFQALQENLPLMGSLKKLHVERTVKTSRSYNPPSSQF